MQYRATVLQKIGHKPSAKLDLNVDLTNVICQTVIISGVGIGVCLNVCDRPKVGGGACPTHLHSWGQGPWPSLLRQSMNAS